MFGKMNDTSIPPDTDNGAPGRSANAALFVPRALAPPVEFAASNRPLALTGLVRPRNTVMTSRANPAALPDIPSELQPVALMTVGSLHQWANEAEISAKETSSRARFLNQVISQVFPEAGTVHLNSQEISNLPQDIIFHLPRMFQFDGFNLTSLPTGLSALSDLYLNNCINMTSLPRGLRVGANLGISGWTSLTVIPSDLRVTHGLQFSNCTSLTSLPSGLKAWPDNFWYRWVCKYVGRFQRKRRALWKARKSSRQKPSSPPSSACRCVNGADIKTSRRC